MDKATSARRQVALEVWLNSYRPQGIDSARWEAVRPFIASCASRIEIAQGSEGLRHLRLLSRLAIWAAAQGLPLDTEVVLDPDTVERFVAASPPRGRTASTNRSVLRRMGLQLTHQAPWQPLPTSLGGRAAAAPYTHAEVAQLIGDVAAQATAKRKRAGRALLALGLGAGLDGRWVTRVAALDVTVVPTGVVVVRVGAPLPRQVPVLERWAGEVLELVAQATSGEFLVGGYSTSRNRTWALVDRMQIPPRHPKLSPARLRSTWLVTHLTMGTRLPELAAAAGLAGVTVVSDLLGYVPTLDQDTAVEMLAGRS